MTVLSVACTGSAAPGKEPETRWERTGYYIKEKYMRLDKFLADMNQGTRKELKQLIRKGLVTVDGNRCDKDIRYCPGRNSRCIQ